MSTSSWAIGVAMVMTAAVVPAVATAQPHYDLLRSFVQPRAQPATTLVELEPGMFAVGTVRGGAFNRGTVVRFDRRSDGSFSTTVRHTFAAGSGPPTSLVEGDGGTLYGTTGYDGSTPATAFRLTPAGVFTTLHVFH